MVGTNAACLGVWIAEVVHSCLQFGIYLACWIGFVAQFRNLEKLEAPAVLVLEFVEGALECSGTVEAPGGLRQEKPDQ